MTLSDYTDEIIRGGFPGLRRLDPGRPLRTALDGYIERIIDHDLPDAGQDGHLLGNLFESLAALSVRTYADACDARIRHLRERDGTHEIDFVLEHDNGYLALEAKLSGLTVSPSFPSPSSDPDRPP